MSDDQAALAGFGGTARLFPLPNLVLFPQVVQGLHIFEPRYRQMTADALAGDKLLALVLLKPGWEDDYDERPEIEPVACLGRITQHELLPDGRYNLRVRGLARFRLDEEVPAGKLYRTARGEVVPDVAPADLARLTALRRQLAEAVLPRFEPSGPAHQHLQDLFAGELPLGPLCDMLAYALPIPLELKQQLLAEPHVDLRSEILAHALELPKAPDGRKFPPDFSEN
jgi:Lon protease-like protein